jgi:hypothetical protein
MVNFYRVFKPNLKGLACNPSRFPSCKFTSSVGAHSLTRLHRQEGVLAPRAHINPWESTGEPFQDTWVRMASARATILLPGHRPWLIHPPFRKREEPLAGGGERLLPVGPTTRRGPFKRGGPRVTWWAGRGRGTRKRPQRPAGIAAASPHPASLTPPAHAAHAPRRRLSPSSALSWRPPPGLQLSPRRPPWARRTTTWSCASGRCTSRRRTQSTASSSTRPTSRSGGRAVGARSPGPAGQAGPRSPGPRSSPVRGPCGPRCTSPRPPRLGRQLSAEPFIFVIVTLAARDFFFNMLRCSVFSKCCKGEKQWVPACTRTKCTNRPAGDRQWGQQPFVLYSLLFKQFIGSAKLLYLDVCPGI